MLSNVVEAVGAILVLVAIWMVSPVLALVVLGVVLVTVANWGVPEAAATRPPKPIRPEMAPGVSVNIPISRTSSTRRWLPSRAPRPALQRSPSPTAAQAAAYVDQLEGMSPLERALANKGTVFSSGPPIEVKS
jgi:hypothetical protein